MVLIRTRDVIGGSTFRGLGFLPGARESVRDMGISATVNDQSGLTEALNRAANLRPVLEVVAGALKKPEAFTRPDRYRGSVTEEKTRSKPAWRPRRAGGVFVQRRRAGRGRRAQLIISEVGGVSRNRKRESSRMWRINWAPGYDNAHRIVVKKNGKIEVQSRRPFHPAINDTTGDEMVNRITRFIVTGEV